MPAALRRVAATRRRWLMRAAVGSFALASAAGMSACGFRLRTAPDFAFDSIWLGFSERSTLGNELGRVLRSGGTVRVVSREQAQVWLEVLEDAQERVIVATNAAGQVREVQLRRRLRFNLRQPDGALLIRDAELVQTRDLNYDESEVLARQEEEALVFRSMQSDLVSQVMRRLAAVSPGQASS